MIYVYQQTDQDATILAQRGLTRYAALMQQHVGLALEPQQYIIGDLTVVTLGPDQTIIVSDGTATLLVNGHPSTPASLRQGVESYLRGTLPCDDAIDRIKQGLVGDYAVLRYDHRTDEWQLAVDGAGQAPLFYVEHDGALLIASALFLLAASVPLELNVTNCLQLDVVGYLCGKRTIYQKVQALEMCDQLAGDRHQWCVQPSWHFIDTSNEAATPEAMADAYLDAMQPRVAGRGVRHALTGGVDSRMVLALLVNTEAEVQAFSERSESPDVALASQVAHAANVPHLLAWSLPSLSDVGQALLLDGCRRVPLARLTYLDGMFSHDLLTTGTLGEGVIHYVWGSR